MVLETTKAKVKRLVKPDVLAKFHAENLDLVDKQDLDALIRLYNELTTENQQLHLRLKQSQKAHREAMQRMKDQQTLGVL